MNNGQVSDLIKTKESKGPAHPSKGQKNCREPRKELGQDTWGFPKVWNSRDM